jgi:hypothetical protein
METEDPIGILPIAIASIILALIEDNKEEELIKQRRKKEELAMLALQARRALDEEEVDEPKVKKIC